ncbi:hypothetical protein [Streptomyces parvus]|uniref:XRE family transcriptional regulator n=1 Tax=Streptomyces parvus TaxID=66428 RepID=A0A5D4JCN3_9ACTN|nr:hypothetical protein [Streptomyces parvus]TYR62726.1 hypothetical protein FY004_18405 [Streptomyces parvus]
MSKQQHKLGSKPHRRELREQTKALGFPEERICAAVAEALERTCHMRPRQAWRLACELALDEAADRYNTVVDDCRSRMRGSRIWDYEQWPRRGVRPTVNVLRSLAEVYGTTWVTLVDVEDLQHMPEEERELYHRRAAAGGEEPRDAAPRADPAPRQAQTPEQEHAPAQRYARAPVRSSPPADVWTPASEPAPTQEADTATGHSCRETAQSAENALGLARFLATTNVDEVSLAQLEAELLSISRACLHASPYPLFLQLTTLHEHIAELLRGHQRPTQTRTLHALVAKCSSLMAWVCDDLGDATAARDHAWAAWRCAGHAEHGDAQRWVRVVRSRLAFASGDFVESAQLANGGTPHSGSDGIESHLLLRRARAWARAGQDGQAREELSAWREAKARQADLGASNGIIQLQAAQEQYFVGAALLDIEDVNQALEALHLALDLFEETPVHRRSYVEHSLSRIDAAKALLTLGAADEAGKVIDPVFGLRPERRVQAILSSLDEFRALVDRRPPSGPRLVRELGVRIEEFSCQSITRTLSPCA